MRECVATDSSASTASWTRHSKYAIAARSAMAQLVAPWSGVPSLVGDPLRRRTRVRVPSARKRARAIFPAEFQSLRRFTRDVRLSKMTSGNVSVRKFSAIFSNRFSVAELPGARVPITAGCGTRPMVLTTCKTPCCQATLDRSDGRQQMSAFTTGSGLIQCVQSSEAA
jgi:hypothetical protein